MPVPERFLRPLRGHLRLLKIGVLKKYRYCKWSTARLLGTFNFPDDVEFHRGDDLVGIVTIQLNRAGEPLVVMSDDIKLNVSNWRYKLEISKH